jgi:hypothetical protein
VRPALTKLAYQAALADAGLTHHSQRSAATSGGFVERREARRQFALTPDERRGGPRLAAFAVAHGLHGDHRAGLAPDGQLPPLAPFERGLDEPACALAHQHFAGPRLRLESRCRIDGIAHGCELHSGERTDDGQPGFDADPHGDGVDRPLPGDLGGAPVDVVHQPQAGQHRSLGVVLVGLWSAEQGQQAISCHMLDGSAEGLGGGGHERDRLADDGTEVLGIQALGQRRRADDVGEQRGDRAPRRLRGGRAQRGSALRAVPRLSGCRRATRGAQGGSALHAVILRPVR